MGPLKENELFIKNCKKHPGNCLFYEYHFCQFGSIIRYNIIQMISYKAPAYDLNTFVSQVFQNSPSTSGGGDIQLSSNNLFTGVNSFDDNIQVGTIESKSTSNDLVFTNTSSSSNATTHYISSPFNEIRTNQHIS